MTLSSLDSGHNGEELSQLLPLQCGLLQGSALSPVLINIYVKPLWEVIRCLGVRHLQYADGTQLYSSVNTSAVNALVSHHVLDEAQGSDTHIQSPPWFGPMLLVRVSLLNVICLTHKVIPVE